MLKKKRYRYSCPIDVTLSVIGGKWKPLVLFRLKRGPLRFNTLLARVPGVSHKVLSQQLKQLEASGLIERRVRGAHQAYALTSFGESLQPALAALASWGLKNHPALDVALDWKG